MYIYSKKERKHFNFTYHGLTLEFELFSKSFILKKLKELEDKKMIRGGAAGVSVVTAAGHPQ